MTRRTCVTWVLGCASALAVSTVSFAARSPPPATQASVTIEDSPGKGLIEFPPLTLTMAQLEALPASTVTLPGGITESGPTLYDVLSSAVPELASVPSGDTRLYVEVTSSEDGASTLVSWDEFDPARNDAQDLLSLGESSLAPNVAPFHLFIPPDGTDTGPRLTTPGDVRGGRYDFGVQIVTVLRAPVVPVPAAGTGPNMSGRNLKSTPLANAYLVGASMQGANLNGGDASGALLVNANLGGANLNNADLSNAMLNGANLSGANLHGADLSGANLTGANLAGANLHGATWSNTTCPDGTSSGDDGGSC